MTTALVIPSNRSDQLAAFFEAWEDVGDWDHTIVVEDNPTRTFDLPPYIHHFAWDDIEETFGNDAWIFSRRDSAIRCFGFFLAWRVGADLTLTLDDDCRPHDDRPICATHRRTMNHHRRWVESVPGMRTRGLPYHTIGRLNNVMASVGLWSDVPDLDAVQTLAGHSHAAGGFQPPSGSRIIPRGQYVPVCGMNLAFRREAAPLFYFPPMGQGQPYRRFDDIWAGVIAKRIMDHLGWHLSVGEPFVRHIRASDPTRNLVAEAPGIAANEGFWEVIDSIPLTATTPAECMAEIGHGLYRNFGDPYLHDLGKALEIWAKLFTDETGQAIIPNGTCACTTTDA